MSARERRVGQVQDNVVVVERALAMLVGTPAIARAEAQVALGRLASWAEAGMRDVVVHIHNEGPKETDPDV